MSPPGRFLIVDTAEDLARQWDAAAEGSWENDTPGRYLRALASWLRDADGYYMNRQVPIPDDPWTILSDALRAAVVYE
jgi:hypothetical protein